MSTTMRGPWGGSVADAVPSRAGEQTSGPEPFVRSQLPRSPREPDPLHRAIHRTDEGVQALQSLLEPLDPDQDRIAGIEALLEALATGQLRLETKLDALIKGLASAGYVRSDSHGPGRASGSGSAT
jgi:hypothetical protein